MNWTRTTSGAPGSVSEESTALLITDTVPTEREAQAAMTGIGDRPGEWVLLSYRLPREPSTPRSSVWRKLRKLGVAQISDGLVALPAGARTREQLEWIAEEVTNAGGTADLWLARPATRTQEDRLAQTMAAARTTEYQALVAAAAKAARPGDQASRAGTVRRLRNELRAIQRRDYFPPADRDLAEAAVQAFASPLAQQAGEPS